MEFQAEQEGGVALFLKRAALNNIAKINITLFLYME